MVNTDVREILTNTTLPPTKLDISPVAFIETPERVVCPLAISSRLESFKAIYPGILPTLPRFLVENLASAKNAAIETNNVSKWFGDDKSRAIDNLVILLSNIDMVDLMTRLDPKIDLQSARYDAEDWKRFWISHYSNPQFLPPDRIRNDSDLVNYARTTLPIRRGKEQVAQQLYALSFIQPQAADDLYALNRYDLTALTSPAHKTILNAAEIALNLAGEDHILQNQVAEGIKRTIEDQAKWWILGVDPLDSLTEDIARLLVKRKVPHAASIILDILYRKAEQDSTTVFGCYNPPENMPFHKESGQLAIDNLIKMAIEADPTEIKQYLAHKFGIGGITGLITEVIIGKPELHQEIIILGKTREVEYFGHKFQLTGLPESEDIQLRELSFGIYVAENVDRNAFWFFQTDPSIFLKPDEVTSVHPVPAENLIFWSEQARKPILPEKLGKFVSDFPQLAARLSKSISKDLSYTSMPLTSIYHLWDYLETATPQERKDLDLFLEQYGGLGILAHQVGEFGRNNIPLIIKFATQTYVPLTTEVASNFLHIKEDVCHSIKLFQSYADISFSAWNFAVTIAKSPQEALVINDLILHRGKALLVAATKTYLAKGYLTNEEQQYIDLSFHAYKSFLLAMADETGETARSMRIPYSMVRNYFKYYDPADADSRALYYSIFEVWYKSSLARQETADYRRKVKGITSEFYSAYEELEEDSTKTTAPPPELEDARYLGDLSADFTEGFLPTEVPAGEGRVIGFWGAGKLREESKIMEYIRGRANENGRGYRFIAIDLHKPSEFPQGQDFAFHEMDMTEVGDAMPNTFDEIYLIWSPLMDVLELDQLKKVMSSIAKSLKPGGKVKIDVHFPFGKHSYQPLIQEYSAINPDEPHGMFEREFARGEGKTPLMKRFFAWDPFTLIPLAGMFSMRCKNFPSNPREIDALCSKVEQDDSFIPAGPQHDIRQQALYRTQGEGGWNRATYIFEMDKNKPDIDHVLKELESTDLESILAVIP